MDLIGKNSKWPDGNTLMKLAEKRLVVCDECGMIDMKVVHINARLCYTLVRNRV